MNLRDAFDYGQVYVALSRAVGVEGLCVNGFSEDKVRVHPMVRRFYETIASAPADAARGDATPADTGPADLGFRV